MTAARDPAGLDDTDLAFLREAIGLAHESLASGDPPYGSLLVARNGRVLARERNTTATDRDLAAHPELTIARWAHRQLTASEVAASILYTSCEPCPMCRNAIARSGIPRVCFALSTGQLEDLKPSGYVNPDASQPHYLGPALYDEAKAPILRSFT